MFASEPASTPALRVAGLRKTYVGGRGVHDVSFEAPTGSLTAFIGANGAGKSTTIRSIVGILSPDAGSIELFGRRACERSRRRIGFLPEERGLNPLDRARDAVAFAARLKGVSRTEAVARADALLTDIGLGERRRARVAELSKGNAQRVQILTAFVHQPELLILDEPFSGLDPEAQGELRAMLLKFRDRGGSVLFSTHALPSAEKFCDRVVILAGGRTLFEGPIEQALAKAPHGAVVRTDDPTVRLIAHVLGGEAVPSACEDGGPTRWRVSLPAHVPYTALMWKLSEAGVEVSDLQPIKADLETAYAEIARTRAA